MDNYRITDNHIPTRNVVIRANTKNEALDMGASHLKTTNIRATKLKLKGEKNPLFIHNGRNYEDAVNSALRSAKTEAEYPTSAVHQGIKTLHGERALFNQIVGDELKRAHVPKALIKKLTSTGG